MFDIAAVKTTLLKSVSELVEAREEYISVAEKMKRLGTRKNRADDLPDLLTNLLDNVFKGVETELEKQYCQKYAVKITVDQKFYEFQRHAFRQEDVYWSSAVYDTLMEIQKKAPHDQVIVLESVVHGMPWKAIKTSLDEQCENVKNLALKAAIYDIHRFLSLDSYYSGAKLKKECLVVSRDFENASWHVTGHVHAIQTLKQALSYIAEETSLVVGHSLDELQQEIVASGQARIPIPPRSRYGKGTAIDVTVFTSKITFTFSPAAVEAIQAATMLYGDNHQVEKLMAVIAPASAA